MLLYICERVNACSQQPIICMDAVCSVTPSRVSQESFVRGVHLEQLCHTCFHVPVDYRAAALVSLSLFVCVRCSLVINFVLFLFVPVFLHPLF